MDKYLSIILIFALFACQKPSSKQEDSVAETQTTTVQTPGAGEAITTPTGLKYIDEVVGTGWDP